MNINTLLNEKQIIKYRFAQSSGMSQTTINNSCSGKVNIRNCTGEILYRLAKTLNVSVESLLSEAMEHRNVEAENK